MDKTIRRYLSKEDKDNIKTAGICYYCGKRVNKDEATVDHIIPVNKGGTNNADNLVCACSSCNTVKGGNTIYEIIKILEEKLKWCGDSEEEQIRRNRITYYIEVFKKANKKRKCK